MGIVQIKCPACDYWQNLAWTEDPTILVRYNIEHTLIRGSGKVSWICNVCEGTGFVTEAQAAAWVLTNK